MIINVWSHTSSTLYIFMLWYWCRDEWDLPPIGKRWVAFLLHSPVVPGKDLVRERHLLSWLMFFRVFLSPLRKMLGSYLKWALADFSHILCSHLLISLPFEAKRSERLTLLSNKAWWSECCHWLLCVSLTNLAANVTWHLKL
jgi:hypothetical protein